MPGKLLFGNSAVGRMLDAFGGVIDKICGNEDQAFTMKARLKALSQQTDVKELEVLETVLRTELSSKDFLQRNWRAIVMLAITGIVINTYFIVPYLKVIFGIEIDAILPDSFFELLSIGVGGYVLGKGVEKGFRKREQPIKLF